MLTRPFLIKNLRTKKFELYQSNIYLRMKYLNMKFIEIYSFKICASYMKKKELVRAQKASIIPPANIAAVVMKEPIS